MRRRRFNVERKILVESDIALLPWFLLKQAPLTTLKIRYDFCTPLLDR